MTSQNRRKHRYLDPLVLQKIGSLSLVARQVVEGLRVGVHKSPLRGFSTEFAHHRQYVAGDAVRHVDWRVYGRTERYYIKLYDAETNFDTYLLLDASSSMRYGSGALTDQTDLCRAWQRIRDARGIVTTDAETKEQLIARVRAILQE